MCEAAALLFHLPDAVETHGNYRDLQILREEADALLKGHHFWGGAVVDDAFRENEDAVAAVGGFTGEAEAFAEAGKLRKWEYVEQRNDQKIIQPPEPAFGKEPFVGRTAAFAQAFGTHGGG